MIGLAATRVILNAQIDSENNKIALLRQRDNARNQSIVFRVDDDDDDCNNGKWKSQMDTECAASEWQADSAILL